MSLQRSRVIPAQPSADLLHKMALFVRVVAAGSLTAAAREQRLSLAAVSRRLRALEEELGVALLYRSTRHLSLTTEGLRFYQGCVGVLATIEQLLGSLRPQEDVGGTVRLNVAVTFGLSCVAPLLAALRAQHPRLSIDLCLEDHLSNLDQDGMDLAIRVGVPPPESGALTARMLASFRRAPFAAPAYLAQRGAPQTVAELAHHEALIHVAPRPLQKAQPGLDRWLLWPDASALGERSEVAVRGALRSNNVQLLHDAALAGLGVALLPEWLAAEAVAAGRLTRLLPGWSTPPVPVYALYRSGDQDLPRVAVVLARLAAGLAERLGTP